VVFASLTRICHVGRNEVAQVIAGTAQLGHGRWNRPFASQRNHGDRSSGSLSSCLFRPTSLECTTNGYRIAEGIAFVNAVPGSWNVIISYAEGITFVSPGLRAVRRPDAEH